MARLTRLVHDVSLQAFERGEASQTLRDLRQVFAETLVPELEHDTGEYAQTLAYGLFAARVHFTGSPDGFDRAAAATRFPGSTRCSAASSTH